MDKSKRIDQLIALAATEIDRGQNHNALKYSQEALGLELNNTEALKYLGNAYINLRRYDESLNVFLRLLELLPGDPIALWAISYSLYQLKRIQEVYPYITECINSGVQLKAAYLILGTYYLEYEKNLGQAIKYFEKEIGIDPKSEKAYGLLGNAFAARGEVDKAITYIRRQIAICPSNHIAHSNLVMYLHYTLKASPQDIVEAAKQAYKNIFSSQASDLQAHSGYKHLDLSPNKNKFRIGFVSGDFKKHAIFYWLRGLFEHIESEDFQVYCYCNNQEDEATALWKQEVTEWRNIRTLDDAQAVQLIQSDKIDILVDLSGHTALNRLGIFVNKPCPLQFTWLGQSGPLGLPQIDYMMTDTYLVPEGEDLYYTEKICRMPDCFAPFFAPQKEIEINMAPCLSNDYVIFGCFNNFMKINNQVLDTWISILKSVKNSRLVLKSKIFNDEEFRKEITDYFTGKGINASRLNLTRHDRNRLEYLEAYNFIDIALDPFPLGGGTTTHDTLWMGVPLVAIYGARMSHRIAADLLKNIGCTELIAKDVNDYIDKAIELAGDFERINAYKATLRDRYRSSSMCDLGKFAEAFRITCKSIWQEKLLDTHNLLTIPPKDSKSA